MNENREDRFARELVEKLDQLGGIITKKDKRIIRQAFERHFREVQKATVTAFSDHIRKN